MGFDRLSNMLEDDGFHRGGEQNYPPYNIERTGEDSCEVTLAVAGFTLEEFAITAADGNGNAINEKLLPLDWPLGTVSRSGIRHCRLKALLPPLA